MQNSEFVPVDQDNNDKILENESDQFLIEMYKMFKKTL